ncbi:M28 family peptidase [Gaetbulibacter sp. M235]|uniref:M28 family peptidase n=1 Tax=Gaetbulibacter sp. M235 TaxID=3126510 RepID=UPI00374ED5D7
MNKIICFCVFICFLSIKSNAQSISENITNKNKVLFNETMLLQNIKTLSSDAFEGRRTGTKGANKAKEYIANQFYHLNVLPLGEKFEQSFYFSSKGKSYNGTNILGLIKGTESNEKYIIISAHYDHEGIKKGLIYNGADDDASGVSALISFAEYFKNNPPKHSIILAAFDAEELGLQGSKYFVNNSIVPINKIMVNLNMDMISRSDTNELFAVGTRFNKTLKEVISNLKQSKTVKLIAGHDGIDGLEDWTDSSDHASFHKKGIPFIYFGVDDHRDYHMPTDDYENIQPEFYKESVKVIMEVFNKIDKLNF